MKRALIRLTTIKLRAKISLGVIAGVAFGVSGVIIFNLTVTKSQLQQSITTNQTETAHRAIDTVNRLLYERYKDVQVIATTPSLEELLAGRAGLDAKLVAINRFKEQTFLSGPWDILFAVDRAGNVIVSSRSGLPKTGDVTTQPHNLAAYQAVLKGEVYVSDLVTPDDTGKPTILFAAPVRDDSSPSKPITGAVIGNYSWPVISEVLRNVQHEGVVNLYTKEGVLISTNQDNSQNLFTKDEEDVPLIRQAISSRRVSSGIIKETSHSPTFLISAAPSLGYLSYKGNDWALLVEIPTSLAFGPVTKIVIEISLLVVLMAALAIVVILLLVGRLIITPLGGLTRVVRAIAAGDMSQRSAFKSNDEIGELAGAFNSMTDKLQDAQQNLQAQVDSRTQQLRQKVDETERLNRTMVDRELRMIELKEQIEALKQGPKE
ncbi:MAG: cache domain-containing protein [Patescibacteria group bacterium]